MLKLICGVQLKYKINLFTPVVIEPVIHGELNSVICVNLCQSFPTTLLNFA